MEHRRRRQQHTQPEQEEAVFLQEQEKSCSVQPQEAAPAARHRRRAQQRDAELQQEQRLSDEQDAAKAQEQPAPQAVFVVDMPAQEENKTAFIPSVDTRGKRDGEADRQTDVSARETSEAAVIPIVDMREGRHGDVRRAQQRPRRTLRKAGNKHSRIYRNRISREKMHEAADRMGQRAVSAGRTAAGYLEGATRSCVFAVRRLFKGRISEDGHAPVKDSYELEAIRPQDYHGKARDRSRQAERHEQEEHAFAQRHRGWMQDGLKKTAAWLKTMNRHKWLTLVFACVALISACMIISILWRTVRTIYTNRKLTKLYTQASEAENTAVPELTVFMPEETAVPGVLAGPDTQDTAAVSADSEPQEETSAAQSMQQTAEEAAQALRGKIEDQADKPTPVPAATAIPMGRRIFHHIGGDALPQMEALYNENRDIVGWLKIENVLDLPVVYRDNKYYLTRDFYKNKNAAGTIFLDENHPFKEKTQNLLLHGHNMKDGTMFGRLLQYETDLNYVRWHPFVKFDTLWRKEEYVIFAVLRVSLDVRSKDFFNYFTHATFASDAEFEAYIRQLQLRSIYAIPIDVKPTDALLTLSTCLEEDRLVIVARRVRSDEDHISLRQLTNLTTRQ